MKSKLLFAIILFILCLTLTGCKPKKDDPTIKKTKYDIYLVSGNMTEEKIQECMRYLKGLKPTREFCRGNEEIVIGSEKYTFEKAIEDDILSKKQLDYLTSYGILVHRYIPPVIYEIMEWIYPLFKTIGF